MDEGKSWGSDCSAHILHTVRDALNKARNKDWKLLAKGLKNLSCGNERGSRESQ